MQNIKAVIVGDGAVGKSCMVISYTTNAFPSEYVPTVFDNYCANVLIDNKPVCLSLWDTAGQEDYDRLRPLSYPETDIFVVCYSIANRTSFENVKLKWFEEISRFSPETPFMLVGLKKDLREENSDNDRFISAIEGKNLASEMSASGFHECSSLTGSGLKEVFQISIQAVLSCSESSRKRKSSMRGKKKRGKRSFRDASGESRPPELPPAPRTPFIEIVSSTKHEDMKNVLDQDGTYDMYFCQYKQEPVYEIVKTMEKKLVEVEVDHEDGSSEDNEGQIDDKNEPPIPEEFVCPISYELMKDPVICSDGFSYEKEEIIKWFERETRSPMTNAQLSSMILIPNIGLKNAIERWREDHECEMETLENDLKAIIEGKRREKKVELREVEVVVEKRVPKEGQVVRSTKWRLGAHRAVIATNSTYLRQLLIGGEEELKLSHARVQNSEVPGIVDVVIDEENGHPTFVIDSTISEDIFRRILEFIYVGSAPISDKYDKVHETITAAKLFRMNDLVSFCENLLADDPDLNPSIGMWLNDENGKKAQRELLNRQLFSDISFTFMADSGSVSTIKAHKCWIASRSRVISKMIANESTVEVLGFRRDIFTAILGYLYSDHCSIKVDNVYDILVASQKLKIPRLVTLCELFISKILEYETRDSVIESDFPIVKKMIFAVENDAAQLEALLVHFLSVNYLAVVQRSDWNDMNEKLKGKIEKKRWPSLKYLEEVENYEKKKGSKATVDSRCLVS